jgi:hypothetical protein
MIRGTSVIKIASSDGNSRCWRLFCVCRRINNDILKSQKNRKMRNYLPGRHTSSGSFCLIVVPNPLFQRPISH